MAYKIQEILNDFDGVMLSTVTYRKVSKLIMQISMWQTLKNQQFLAFQCI